MATQSTGTAEKRLQTSFHYLLIGSKYDRLCHADICSMALYGNLQTMIIGKWATSKSTQCSLGQTAASA